MHQDFRKLAIRQLGRLISALAFIASLQKALTQVRAAIHICYMCCTQVIRHGKVFFGIMALFDEYPASHVNRLSARDVT
jgi:hypothetical protein